LHALIAILTVLQGARLSLGRAIDYQLVDIFVLKAWNPRAGSSIESPRTCPTLREWRIARLSAAGLQPEYADLDWSGLNFEKDRFAQIMRVDRALWDQECQVLDELFQKVSTNVRQLMNIDGLALNSTRRK